MADTTAATGLTVQQWDDKFFVEYQGNHPFNPYMGTSEQSIIQINEQLSGQKGQAVTFALLNKLTGAAVTGSSTLEGNEEAMDSRSFVINVDKSRNGVRVSDIEEQYSAIGLRNAARPNLMEWAKNYDTDRIIAALGSKNGVAYGSASETVKDTWLADNTDRVLFGDAIGNRSGTDHSASLTAITSGMTLDTGILSLMKRIALTANPKIRPVRMGNLNRRYYVAFVHPLAMRDLKADSVLTQAQREVQITSQNEKIFQGGDVDYDGIIVHEVDDMPVYTGVGAAGAVNVSPVYLCGAQALGHARCKRWKSVTEEFDYGDKHGVAVETIDGIAKIEFGSGAGDTDALKDHGVVTGYVATAADA